VQIVVFSKARLAALEEYITLAVVIYFYLVRRSVAGHLSQNSFAELPALHKFSKFQRETLMFMALGTSKSKKSKTNSLHMVMIGEVALNLRPDLWRHLQLQQRS
jgi:hypothetical protein